jgi:hypothetical protein
MVVVEGLAMMEVVMLFPGNHKYVYTPSPPAAEAESIAESPGHKVAAPLTITLKGWSVAIITVAVAVQPFPSVITRV